jgi:broad specificity phosphatase PhoE
MTLYVLRHAEKEDGEFHTNRLPLNDQPLSENGKLQAANLAGYFENIDIDTITVSRYLRTSQTIAPVSTLKRIVPKVDQRLDEVNIGMAEHLSDEQLQADYPDFWSAFLARDRDFSFPNGESGEEAGTRIYELFCSLDASKNHILVCHDGIIRVLICKVLGLPTYKRHLFKIDFCSITLFEYSPMFQCWTVPQVNMTLPTGACS